MRSQETYKVVSLGVCSLQMMWFWWMRVGWGLMKSWSCGDEHWRQKVLGSVGLKWSSRSVISVLQQRRREMFDSMVRRNPRKTHFATRNRWSKKMEIVGDAGWRPSTEAPLSVNTRIKLHLSLRSYRPKASCRRPTNVIGCSQPPHVSTHR
jgi:hypothetical protein